MVFLQYFEGDVTQMIDLGGPQLHDGPINLGKSVTHCPDLYASVKRNMSDSTW